MKTVISIKRSNEVTNDCLAGVQLNDSEKSV